MSATYLPDVSRFRLTQTCPMEDAVPIFARRDPVRIGMLGVVGLVLSLTGPATSQPAPGRPSLHFTVNLGGDYERAAAVGFNLVDIGSPSALDRLPEGRKGVLWLGNGFNTACHWRLDDAQVRTAVEAVRNHPK